MSAKDIVHIFGAGPTGMTLAWILSKKGKKVVLYEKYKEPGGTWTTKWLTDDNKKWFTQHSPQILSTAYVNTFDLWDEMGIDHEKFLQSYKSSWTDMDTTFVDKLNLALSYFRYLFNESKYEKITVSDFFKGKLSDKGIKSLTEICYLLDGVPPSIMTVNELFGSFDQTFFYSTMEMSKASGDDGGFAKLWCNKLIEKGVVIIANTTLDRLEDTGEGTAVLAYTKEDSEPIKIEDEIILALDPMGLYKVLNSSSDKIKDNWGGWDKLSNHILDGIYVSLSVQFHFEEGTDISVDKATKMGASTDWGIICVPVPLTVSKTPTLSSTILNMNAYSSVLNKNVDACSYNEVMEEAWRQIRQANPNLPDKPLDITIGSGTSRDEESGWRFDLSSACRTTLGPLESRGKREKLSIVGPLNKRRFKPTTMEAAVESAKLFTGEEIRSSLPLSNAIKCTIVIIFLIIVVKVLYKR